MITIHREVLTFQNDFYILGTYLIQSIDMKYKDQLQSLDTFSTDITTQVGNQSAPVSWPFIALHESASILERYMPLMDASILTIVPIVPATLRTEWELYSVQQQGWM
jgi:hypothetical protein